MPKVIGFTPPWLSRPSPGARIFSDPAPQSPAPPSKKSTQSSYLQHVPASYNGPQRLIATRGSEIFTVVGNKIRWADLSKVKNDWEDGARPKAKSGNGLQVANDKSEDKGTYRELLTPVYYQIRQLLISPSGNFMAICTEHTIHIAIIPDSSRLSDQDRSPLKLKTFHLGPTIHVIPESPLVAVLWHPLAASTMALDCLVTVTSEAAVRIWQLDSSNQWSFERPALAVDLRKLADGVSCDQDFEPSSFGKNRGFSVDDFDMEAAAACFGGRGQEDEDAWAAMTLWVAMKNGDIYALCPLLPSRWRPSPSTIPSLSTSAIANVAAMMGDDVDKDASRAADQQYEWVQEIDNSEPVTVWEDDVDYKIHQRPQNPSAIPRLQGPFQIQSDDEALEFEVTDICVFPSRIDEREIFSSEDIDENYDSLSNGVPFTTIILTTSEHEVVLALSLEGISGLWLPKKGRSTFEVPSNKTVDLALVDIVPFADASKATSEHWPQLTPDPQHDYSVFLSIGGKVYSISVEEWVSRIGSELDVDSPADQGLKTRLDINCPSQICLSEEILSIELPAGDPCAPAIVTDHNLGTMLLTVANNTVHAAVFEPDTMQALPSSPTTADLSFNSIPRHEMQLSLLGQSKVEESVEPLPTRSPYAPAQAFYFNTVRPIDQLRQSVPPHHRRALTEKPLKLSPACLGVMTSAHRIIAAQTSELEKAAAELFRRCERLRDEMNIQVKQMAELGQQLHRLKSLKGGSDDTKSSSHENRITAAQERQKSLAQRYDALRRKSAKVGTGKQELTAREVAWVEEITSLSEVFGVEGEDGTGVSTIGERYAMVRQLAQELLEESRRVEIASPSASTTLTKSESPQRSTLYRRESSASIGSARRSGVFTSSPVPSRLQKERIADVMTMVEREGAVIDAVLARLDRLNVAD